MVSADLQKKHALDIGLLPTLPALYSDADILTKYPFFKNMLPAFENAVARPSSVTGADYNQVATAISQNVNNVLTGKTTPQEAVSQIQGVATQVR